MYQELFLSNLFLSIFIIFRLSSCHSASITTLQSSSTYHHSELISNNSYRNFFLRQYFIDLLNISHSPLIQSMITNHYLTTNLEQIKNRRRRKHITNKPFSLTPMYTLHSKNCLTINNNQIQSTFQWSHTITTLSSIELIYDINSTEIKPLKIPIKILIKQLQTFNELLSINTYLQFDSIRNFYFLNMYDYFLQINNPNVIIETIIHNQTCQTLQTYIIMSSLRSNSLISNESPQEKTICKVKTIQIKFEELGLANLFIRPKEYTFSYCDGSCSNLTLSQQSQLISWHAYIQSLISKKNSNIPQLKCVPSQYTDDNFLLRQPDGSIEIYPIKNAIVKQCTCL
ncbi:unnamed protein product [Adineta steineri]|uniref:TGF-beta family profile domain-containing protein n=1 Tax=Adineta steineri TaxID=433720 RepID=A0A814UDS1_9BILA|nr:unnamed protein product [Adineta steineri]CAF3890374.1 unnamed protein product [Adineta steineri]